MRSKNGQGDGRMTLNGAIKQLHELRCNEDVPVYLKPAIAEVINVLLMDAQEVGHGRWEPYLNEGLIVKCSVCGSRYVEPWNYCPNCGARMDLEENEDE